MDFIIAEPTIRLQIIYIFTVLRGSSFGWSNNGTDAWLFNHLQKWQYFKVDELRNH